MKLTLKELPLIGIVLLSSIWLLFGIRYRKTHWNYKGEVDKWGDKYSLIPIVLLPVLTYVLMYS
jgi:hypothetical protein